MKYFMIIYYLKYQNRTILENIPRNPWTINIICRGKSYATQIPRVTNEISVWCPLDLNKMP